MDLKKSIIIFFFCVRSRDINEKYVVKHCNLFKSRRLILNTGFVIAYNIPLRKKFLQLLTPTLPFSLQPWFLLDIIYIIFTLVPEDGSQLDGHNTGISQFPSSESPFEWIFWRNQESYEKSIKNQGCRTHNFLSL